MQIENSEEQDTREAYGSRADEDKAKYKSKGKGEMMD
jgi:hypothetical protein